MPMHPTRRVCCGGTPLPSSASSAVGRDLCLRSPIASAAITTVPRKWLKKPSSRRIAAYPAGAEPPLFRDGCSRWQPITIGPECEGLSPNQSSGMREAAVASHSSPEADAERQEVVSAVHRAVAGLPPKYRDLVILYYFQSSDLSEAAASLGLREGTAKARLHRARLLLQNRLKKIVA